MPFESHYNNHIETKQKDTNQMNGYNYVCEYETEEDVRKMYHYAIAPRGQRIAINWTPYEEMTTEDFKLWIHLGMPDRPNRGSNFNHKTLIEYLNKTIEA